MQDARGNDDLDPEDDRFFFLGAWRTTFLGFSMAHLGHI